MAATGTADRGNASPQRSPGAPGEMAGPAGWAAVGVPGAVVLALDGYDLGRLSLWRDEAYTVDAAHRSLPQIITLLHHTDAVNSTYYLLMHAVIAVAGTSAAALRLPSLLAMAVAAVITSAIGTRLARAAGLPSPPVCGLLAGLLFAASPQVTRYAQEARPYGIVTMLTAAATYLLLRAVADGRWRWWAGYGAVIALAGAFNLFAVLLVAAHAVTLLTIRARQRARLPRVRVVRVPRWLVAEAGAAAVLTPLIALGYRQRRQIGWLGRPGWHAISHLVISFAGSAPLVPLTALLALGGVLASLSGAPGRGAHSSAAAFWPGAPGPPVSPATVALPWLVLPPVILLSAAQLHPVFDGRYVVFCLPALALLSAAGLVWLARLAGQSMLARRYAAAAWLPVAAVTVLLAVLLAGPQRAARLPSSRPDNLRAASAIVAARERPGDAVLYLPSSKRVFGMGYPAPFRRLRDIALAKAPVAAANLLGTEVSPAALRQRFTTLAGRVWVVSERGMRVFRHPVTRLARAKVALLGRLRLIGRWYAGSVMLSLFGHG